MPKAIIFDLDGVFIQSPYLSDRFRDDFGIPTSEFLPALKEIMDKVRQPNASPDFTYWQPYLEKWGIKFSEKEFFDYWFNAEKANEEMIALAQDLKRQGIRLFILSNNFAERAKYYDDTFPWLKELFEKVYYSWQTGFIKPDPRCWQNILTENNLQPEDCVYFDDSQTNTQTAEGKVGIISYIFRDKNQVKNILPATRKDEEIQTLKKFIENQGKIFDEKLVSYLKPEPCDASYSGIDYQITYGNQKLIGDSRKQTSAGKIFCEIRNVSKNYPEVCVRRALEKKKNKSDDKTTLIIECGPPSIYAPFSEKEKALKEYFDANQDLAGTWEHIYLVLHDGNVKLR